MRTRLLGLCTALLAAGSIGLNAGGRLETIDITGNVPSPIPGHFVARVIGIQWDVRSIPAGYSINTTLDPIPNPLGPAFLSVADITAAVQRSLDAWNNIPTSHAEMHVMGTTANPGLRGFDMVNEVTFRTAASFGAIASSPSVSLIADTTFVHGMDIDGDGDNDVDASLARAADADGDGDVEFPPGFYKAGTILDNDVQFNTNVSNGFRYTLNPAQADTVTRSVDFFAVAVHEFGHSIGLSHTLDNQKSATDGNGATMYPFIDTGDPASELAQGTLDSDDIAWASYVYPEGTGSGPAALQPGDVAFASVYGLITGEIRHGVLGQPVAGASVLARNRDTGVAQASAFSGTTVLSFNPANGFLFLVNPAFNILDGRYVIPVPRANYAVDVEPVDGAPVAAGSISFTAQIGSLFGQQVFNEELFNNKREGSLEKRSGQDMNVHVNPGKVHESVDIVTNRTANIANFGNRNFIGFTGAAAGTLHAVRIPASQITAAAAAASWPRYSILAAEFDTAHVDASVPVVFAEAMLTTGVVDAAGNIISVDLANPLERATGFLAADNDFAPLHFRNPHELGDRVAAAIAGGAIENLFLVLRLPLTTPFAGVSGRPPLIGLDGGVATNDVPIFGLSYTSANGGATWTKSATFNYRFGLVLTKWVP